MNRLALAMLLASSFSGTAPAGPDVPTGTVVVGPIGERIDAYFSRMVRFGFSGGVVAMRDGVVLVLKGYGLADRENGVPFTPDTRFSIGSNTKPITSIAIQRLQTMGKLSTDDFVSDHLAGVPEDRESWTLHELLTHTSGLPAASGYDYSAFSRDDLVRFAFGADLLFPPRQRYEYSNVGFSLLAAIVEVSSGMSYEEFTQRHVFAPAGMTRTGYRLDVVPRGEYAHGYRGEEDWGVIVDKYWTEDGPSWHLMGNGATQSTLRDMLRFHLALLDDTIVDDDAREEMFLPYVDEGGGDSFYGYGWTIRETARGTKDVWHSGGNPYFRNEMHRYLEEDAYLYIHTNDGTWPAGPFLAPAEEMLFGGAPPLPPELAAIDEAALDACAGTYDLGAGASFDVVRDGAALRVSPEGERAFGLVHAAGSADTAEVERRRARTEETEELVRAALFDAEGTGFLVGNLRRAQQEEGPFDGVRAVGTIPMDQPLDGFPADTEMTVVLLRRTGGEMPLIVLWSGPGIVGLDQIGSFEASPRLYAVGDDRFESFVPGAGRRVVIRFERTGGGPVTGMRLEGATGEVLAVRAD